MIAKYNNKYYNIKNLKNGDIAIWTPKEEKDFTLCKTKTGQTYYAKKVKPEDIEYIEITFKCEVKNTELYIERFSLKNSKIIVSTYNKEFAKENNFEQTEDDIWEKEYSIEKPECFYKITEYVFTGKSQKRQLTKERFIKEYKKIIKDLKLKK